MTNRLGGQTSPYLRQHAENPVDWWPWSTEAFETATDRDLPVLLSIGYSSCHWCHVMAHESFEDLEIAKMINDWFVPIKVDREERPDVDAVYMEATQAMTGHGGWPMTVFMAPDGRPFHCGTYYPPRRSAQMPGFAELLEAVHEAWAQRREELLDQAGQLSAVLGRDVPRGDTESSVPGEEILQRATESLLMAHDNAWGGFGRAPKFPQSFALGHLLRHHQRTGSDAAWRAVTTSLDAMSSGGMVDLIGGGFSRYSVDAQWLVPHFEKMLYDNALLIRLYAEAHTLAEARGDSASAQRYGQVTAETIDYVLATLSHPDGGRYSAEDADSLVTPDAPHTEEGAFYVFTPREVAAILDEAGLGEHAEQACEWWGVTDAGNFEGASIPNRLHARGMIARPPGIEAARMALHAARARRPRPGLDDKVLTEWNALWVAAAAQAGAMMGRTDWIAEARRTAVFLCDRLRRDQDGRWLRSWQSNTGSGDAELQQGTAQHLAYGSDLAALTEAFVTLYCATGEPRWLTEAESSAEQLLVHFWDPDGGIFTTGDDAEELLVRPRETMDGATPSASSTASVALLALEALTGETRYGDHARQILNALGPLAAQMPLGFSRLLASLDMSTHGLTEIVITGDRPDLVAVAQRRFAPSSVLAWGEPTASPLWQGRQETGADGRAYVCEHHTCEAPVSTPEDLRRALENRS